MTQSALTPTQLSEEWGVSSDVILAWIHAGELPTFDVARPGCVRPRWRIERDSADDFKRRRAATPAPKPARRRRRDPAVRDYSSAG